MVITLMGFMGCGKSSVGRLLAQELGFKFTDMDEYVSHKTASSCAKIIETFGEEHFRAIEADAFRDLMMIHGLTDESIVVALGGGTPTIFGIEHLIFGKTLSVFLDASPAELKRRVASDSEISRPLFDENNFETLLNERMPVYRRADNTIQTDGMTLADITKEIINIVNNGKHQH